MRSGVLSPIGLQRFLEGERHQIEWKGDHHHDY